jgi:NAD(P)-dependent dehydrogenase (short-subunit alcohol dehydrogenase family)
MKTIVITGATSGIGREVARQMLNQGYVVISNSRNKVKSDMVKNELVQETHNKNIFFFEGDFSSFKSVRNFAGRIKIEFSTIDVLINNAGTWEVKFIETADGIETNLQVNHLSPMLLTFELIPMLVKSKNPRIINTSSGAHRRDIPDLNDPEWRLKEYNGVATYSLTRP